jgi:dihydropteroate synthase
LSLYYRPLVQVGPGRPAQAQALAGGWGWFTQVEVLHRVDPPQVIDAADVPQGVLHALCAPRAPIAGLGWDRPRLMGIVNATPDSFSDGGQHATAAQAVAGAQGMAAADLLDVGGESTRPGAAYVDPSEEIGRVVPVIRALREAGVNCPISIDTRKAQVAEAALKAGANIVNDVAGFTFDPDLAPLCARGDVPVCVMHAQGDPATMQDAPQYENVLLDVFDFLKDRIAALQALGIPKDRIIADPGIGFGKTQAHNLALLARLSLFHGLGVPLLLGASRKKFIGTIGMAENAKDRAPGSIAVGLAALGQGVQILRVHDVAQTAQAVALWRASIEGKVIL